MISTLWRSRSPLRLMSITATYYLDLYDDNLYPNTLLFSLQSACSVSMPAITLTGVAATTVSCASFVDGTRRSVSIGFPSKALRMSNAPGLELTRLFSLQFGLTTPGMSHVVNVALCGCCHLSSLTAKTPFFARTRFHRVVCLDQQVGH